MNELRQNFTEMSSTSYEPSVAHGYTTSWLPFTTAWTAPEECSTLYVSYSGYSGLTAFAPDYENHGNTSIACNPPEVMTYYNQDEDKSGSVGAATLLGPFTCPDNWFDAMTSVISQSTTLTHCCPK